MPSYKVHLSVGLVAASMAAAAYMYFFNMLATPLSLVMIILCTLAGALLPDIDTKSQGQKLWFGIDAIILVYALLIKNYILATCLGITAMAAILSGHRHVFHSLIFWIVTAGIALLVLSSNCSLPTCYYCASIYVGVLTHLLLDWWF